MAAAGRSRACGVHDYGEVLARALARRGHEVEQRWVPNDGDRLGRSIAAATELLTTAFRRQGSRTVVWNYAAFAHSYRGMPLPGVLFGIVQRWRGRFVVTVVHEAGPLWAGSWRLRAQALAHKVALRAVLLGSDVVVATTADRATALSSLTDRPVRCLPVFSNLPVVGATPDHPGFVIGAFGYATDGFRRDLLIDALQRLHAEHRRSPGLVPAPRLVLLGAPGPGSSGAREWRREAAARGVAHLIEVTGILEPAELSERLGRCDVVALLYPEGLTSRRSTLAAALAHGKPVLGLVGPKRWDELIAAGAVAVAEQNPRAVSTALIDLARSPQRREELARRASDFYDRELDVDHLADRISALLYGAQSS